MAGRKDMRGRARNQGTSEYGKFPSPPHVNRYFQVTADGWYVESPSGEYGPFRNHRDAEQFARALLDEPPVKDH